MGNEDSNLRLLSCGSFVVVEFGLADEKQVFQCFVQLLIFRFWWHGKH